MPFSVKVIADTINPNVPSSRVTTFEYSAPRAILAEINTHGVLAKSAASSRAIPVNKRIDMAIEDVFTPTAFGKNKPGMSASEVLSTEQNEKAVEVWLKSRDHAVESARKLAELEVHKEHANRILEPFVFFKGVITGTEWENFEELRTHQAAQPEFRILAEMMISEKKKSVPKCKFDHLPYTDDLIEQDYDLETLRKISAARCARVSYKTFDGKPSTVEADIKLCCDLQEQGHYSPFDHVATADDFNYTEEMSGRDHSEPLMVQWLNPDDHRRFWGFIPYRVQIEKLAKKTTRRSSFSYFSL
jgi:thymidylate synthase ThyX